MLESPVRWAVRAFAAAALLLALAPAGAFAAPTWLEEQRVDPSQTTIYGLSCPSVTMCAAAAGSGPIVQDGDFPSFPAVDPSPEHSPTDVSCATGTKFCMFVDDGGGAFPYENGTYGARVNVAGGVEFQDVSCPVAGFCMAIDTARRVFKFGDGSWDDVATLTPSGTPSSFANIACASATFCVAVVNSNASGTYGTYPFTYNGTSWSVAGTPFNTTNATQAYTTSLSCTAATFCMAGHQEGRISIFNGTWSTKNAPDFGYNQAPRPRVACVGTTCMLVDPFANWSRSTDGGQNWSPLVNMKQTGLPSGIGNIRSLACASADLCVAGDLTGEVTTFAEPPATTNPAIAGSALVGETLTLTHGAVATPGAWVQDRWWRCEFEGSACDLSPISTSTTSYTLSADDVAHFVEAREYVGFGFYVSNSRVSNVIGPVCNVTCDVGTTDGGPTDGGTTDGGATDGGTSGGGTTTGAVPTLSGVSIPTTKAGAPIRISLTLGGPASKVVAKFARKSRGRRVGRKCVAQTKRNRKKRSCTYYKRIGSSIATDVSAGSSVVTIRRNLRPGTYRVTVRSFDSAGTGLEATRVTFRVVR